MAETATRIYLVVETDRAGKLAHESLVRASSQAQAIKHAAKGRFSADVCTTDEAIRLATAGVVVGEAGAE
jgi:hypothetical protein